eukprot:480228-Rhodomonas_salina.4
MPSPNHPLLHSHPKLPKLSDAVHAANPCHGTPWRQTHGLKREPSGRLSGRKPELAAARHKSSWDKGCAHVALVVSTGARVGLLAGVWRILLHALRADALVASIKVSAAGRLLHPRPRATCGCRDCTRPGPRTLQVRRPSCSYPRTRRQTTRKCSSSDPPAADPRAASAISVTHKYIRRQRGASTSCTRSGWPSGRHPVPGGTPGHVHVSGP